VVPTHGPFSEEDSALLGAAAMLIDQARRDMREQALHLVLAGIWRVVAEANRYFAAQEPWALRKSDPARMATVLYVTAEVLRRIGIMVQPFMPAASAKLLDLLAVPAGARMFADLAETHRLSSGTNLPAAIPIFPRYVEPASESE
jgi:methionyl-tRNA synthetase